MKKNIFIGINLLLLILSSLNTLAQNKTEFYLGIEPPGNSAKIFMPGLVTTGLPTRDIAITPDGNEIYFTVHGSTFLFSTILFIKHKDGRWMKPEVAPFAKNSNYAYTEPCISQDGKKLFFVSNKPKDITKTEKADFDIWIVEKTNNGWSEPYNLGTPINSSSDEFFPSITNNGTIYFTREAADKSNAIYKSRYVEGKYSEPEKLPEHINIGVDRFNAFIDPEEKYLIVSVFRAKDGKGAADYYIAQRNIDDTWQVPINMGEKVNSQFNEYSPYVTRDGKYFFFMSTKPNENLFKEKENFSVDWINKLHNSPGNGNSTIYWISTQFINELTNGSAK